MKGRQSHYDFIYRSQIKQKCRVIDDKITDIAEESHPKLESYLLKLSDLMQRKIMLKNNIESIGKQNPIDSDIVEFKAIITELSVDSDYLAILKNRNLITAKKKKMVGFLNGLLKDANSSKDRVLKLLDQTPMYKEPKIKSENNHGYFEKEIVQLEFVLQEKQNEKQFLEDDIERLTKELNRDAKGENPSNLGKDGLKQLVAETSDAVKGHKSQLF